MSHFSVLVIGEDVEELLAPYQENNMGDCPTQYLEFHDVEEQYRKEYETEMVDRVIGPNGESFSLYDERCRNPKYDFMKGNGPDNEQYVPPAGFVEKEMKISETYTWDEYMTEYCGYKKNPENGRYGYFENPDAKWDWWQVGGRYSNKLKVLSGREGIVHKVTPLTGFKSKHELVPAGEFVDQARVKDIDWEGMKAKRIADRQEWWDAYELELLDPNKAKWAAMNYGIKEGQTREQYIAQAEDFSVFAIVTKDGKWFEKGEMGWWAIVTNEKEDKEWKGTIADILKSLDPEDVLTVVDCHI